MRTSAARRVAGQLRSERGTVVIMVAVALLGLLAFSAFSVDHGVMMTGRAQVQNAADAGAMAAALYLAWDDPADLDGAREAAVATAQRNLVVGDTPDVTVADVTFPTCPPGAPGLVDMCVRVDVFRNQRANGNPLPVFFASLVGIAEQGVQATATAQVLFGSGPGENDCVKPFAVPDRWLELVEDEAGTPPADDDGMNLPNFPYDEDWFDDWDPDDSYDSVYTLGANRGQPLAGARDVTDPSLYGYQLTPNPQQMVPDNDNGIQLVLKEATGGQIAPSWYYPYVIADGCGTGANCYRDRITGCVTTPITVGDALTNEPGSMQGPTMGGVGDLIAQDPDATWGMDATHPRGIVQGGEGMESPRLAVVPTFDAEIYVQGHQNGRIAAGDAEIVVTGWIGIFFEQVQGSEVVVHIAPVDFNPSPTNLTDDTSSFLRTVVLVR